MVTAAAGVAASLTSLRGRDFLSSADTTAEETASLLQLAAQLKSGDRRIDLGNRVLGLIFTKASTRTRVSFQVAMARLGGQTVDLNPSVTQLGRGEPLEDPARVLSRYCDALAIRTFAQQEIADYAHWASVPVINALTDLEHPCQALADFLTMQEVHGDLAGQTLAYIGDGNNVAHSLMICGALLGVNVRIGCPDGFEPLPGVLDQARSLAQHGAVIEVTSDPVQAVSGAQAVYTDVWASMGQEGEVDARAAAFGPYQVNEELFERAGDDAIFLHCLPAHRGVEVTDGVMDHSRSAVFDQAENRLHAFKALLMSVTG